MTLEEARASVGAGVVYTPQHVSMPHSKREDGVITSVGEQYIFVRYSGDTHSKATAPQQLQLLVETRAM